MWSFGSKREDHVQVSPEKMQNGNNHQQQQASSNLGLRNPLPTRTSGGSRSEHHQPQEKRNSPRGGGSLAAKSRMFYKNKKLSSTNNNSTNTKNNAKSHAQRQQQPPTLQQEAQNDRNNSSRTKNFIGKRYFGGGSNKNNNGGANNDDYLQGVSVDETSNGIEVSFPGSQATAIASSSKKNSNKPSSGRTPVFSLKEQIRQRQRVYKSQFSTVLPASNDATSCAINTNNWRPKGHRIPLLGITSADAAYTDTLHLLQTAPIVDERTAVKQELNYLQTEISSLERDRIWLEQSLKNTSSSNQQQQTDLSKSRSNGSSNHRGTDSTALNKENAVVTWDVHKLLKEDAIRKKPLNVSERSTLQKQRGNSLTIHLSNTRTQEMFVHKSGGKLQHTRSMNIFKNDDSITTIMPNNHLTPNAATTLQHVGLISATETTTDNAGLYFSRDVGKSQSIGQLPNKLYRRLKDGEGTAGRPEIGDLLYLSTGSRGCYFTEFQLGECWWGSAVEDADFFNIMHTWDVYRVAFGPIDIIEQDHPERQIPTAAPSSDNKRNNSKAISTMSWFILSHDGRAAWKNLPSRLSNKLDGRLSNSAAPVEVSLGPGDSYFVRFLDGSIDYSLPSKIARVCERIEQRGGSITNVCLHPDLSHDFVIRHTELTR